MPETSSSKSISTKRRQIADLAQRLHGKRLTTLANHLDVDWVKEAHRRTRKPAAAGIDGQTAEDYEVDLEADVRDLVDRAKNGDRYRAPPVRRVEIPKNAHETRLLGIPTHEDKVLQRAILMLLEPVYEQDVLECSSPRAVRTRAHSGQDPARVVSIPPREVGSGGSSDFLGFTFYWGRSRRGARSLKVKTATARQSRALRQSFVCETRRLWFKWLNRRDQRHRHNWVWFKRLEARYPLPRQRLVFSLYHERIHRTRSRMR